MQVRPGHSTIQGSLDVVAILGTSHSHLAGLWVAVAWLVSDPIRWGTQLDLCDAKVMTEYTGVTGNILVLGTSEPALVIQAGLGLASYF